MNQLFVFYEIFADHIVNKMISQGVNKKISMTRQINNENVESHFIHISSKSIPVLSLNTTKQFPSRGIKINDIACKIRNIHITCLTRTMQ